MLGSENDKEIKYVAVKLLPFGSEETAGAESTGNEWIVGYAAVSGKTRWDHLDHFLRKLFAEYVRIIDPVSHLGLDNECLACYRIGEVARPFPADDDDNAAVDTTPELLPCGYLVGDCNHISLCVKANSKYALPASLALDTLIPLPFLNR